jgi:hypothetical protein
MTEPMLVEPTLVPIRASDPSVERSSTAAPSRLLRPDVAVSPG